jgi:hypothetical protein
MLFIQTLKRSTPRNINDTLCLTTWKYAYMHTLPTCGGGVLVGPLVVEIDIWICMTQMEMYEPVGDAWQRLEMHHMGWRYVGDTSEMHEPAGDE